MDTDFQMKQVPEHSFELTAQELKMKKENSWAWTLYTGRTAIWAKNKRTRLEYVMKPLANQPNSLLLPNKIGYQMKQQNWQIRNFQFQSCGPLITVLQHSQHEITSMEANQAGKTGYTYRQNTFWFDPFSFTGKNVFFITYT